MGKKVLIIGGVAAGMKTASRLRRRDKDAEITVIERGELVSYGACGFPYYIGDEVKNFDEFTHTPQGIARDVDYFKKVKGIDVLTGHEAQKINRAAKTVTVLNRKNSEVTEMPYDVLVLGTGATPVRLPVPGADLEGIHNFWFPWEVLKVKEEIAANNVTDVVIVGAGFIGMELAEEFNKIGVKVSVVEMQNRILPQMLDLEMAELAAKPVAAAGINLYLEEKTVAFEGKGRVAAVKTDKRTIPAQMVIVAVGVRPNVELAREAGLAIGPSGAIAVNEYMQTNDHCIYAGGDCAENTHRVSGAKIFAPMGSTANKHGRIIADNICGDMVKYPGVLGTGLCRMPGVEAGSTGLNEKTAAAAGIDFESVIVPGNDRLAYMPGAGRLVLKLFADRKTHKVIGVQAVGQNVDKRIDTLVAAISMGAALEDLSEFDIGYAPPFNGPIDNIATAANVLLNKIEGRLRSINPKEFKELRKNENYTLVDVRTPGEFKNCHIAGCCNIVNLPLDEVRSECCKVLPDKDARLVCSCQIDLRGYEAETMLRAQGYKNVQSLEGSMSAWPYETEKSK